MRFRLRTLMIVMAIGPMALAALWSAYGEHFRRLEHFRQEHFRLMMTITPPLIVLDEEEFLSGVEPSEPPPP